VKALSYQYTSRAYHPSGCRCKAMLLLALAELRKLKESALYYQKAVELDPTLREWLEPVIERLERSQQVLEKAQGVV